MIWRSTRSGATAAVVVVGQVRVLTTIAWTTSAHHAAVNFGQYDFSSLLLNVSALVRD